MSNLSSKQKLKAAKKYQDRNKYGNKEKGGHARTRAQLLSLCHYKDMLTGEVIPDFKSASFHHLIKTEFGGEYTAENGAMLLWTTHNYIHKYLEINDTELYDFLMECLIYYNYCLANNQPELVQQFEEEVQPIMRKLVKDSNKKM